MRNIFKIMSFIIVFNIYGAVKNGEIAPNFTLLSSTKENIKLSDFKGKTVVLEWLNHGCPFVKKHYKSGNMQALQKKYTDQGVIWLSVISSAPGKQGHSTPEQAESDKKKQKSNATAVLIDETGKIGKVYNALTTPHMYIINPKGILVYQGAIDNRPTADLEDVKGAKNYVALALEESLKNNKVKIGQTKAYGCSVKY